MAEDCYVFWDNDENIPESERGIYLQCVKCHEKNNKGQYWSAKDGYSGPVNCFHCKRVISDKKEIPFRPLDTKEISIANG